MIGKTNCLAVFKIGKELGHLLAVHIAENRGRLVARFVVAELGWYGKEQSGYSSGRIYFAEIIGVQLDDFAFGGIYLFEIVGVKICVPAGK